jgi:hypothetical protein
VGRRVVAPAKLRTQSVGCTGFDSGLALAGLLQSQVVPETSGARKSVAVARVVGRMAGARASGNRWLRATYRGASSIFHSFSHVLSVLWHQVTGVFFLAFATIGALACIREYRSYAAGKVGPGRVILVAGFALLFGYFALSNFMRAGRRT